MREKTFRVVHYINQFFAQIGGEEFADIPMEIRKGTVGPGVAFAKELGDSYEITATIICGDNYFAGHENELKPEIIEVLKKLKPDLLIAGPAFNAGRYGSACGSVCKIVKEELSIPVFTGMYEENPGVEMYRKDCYISKTDKSAAGMRKAVIHISSLIRKVMETKEEVLADVDGYFDSGRKKNVFCEKNGAERAVDMLVAKLSRKSYHSEIQMPAYENVVPAAPVKDMKHAKIALVTDAGITDETNSYHLESARASKVLSLSIKGLKSLLAEKFRSVHGGFDTGIANKNPNVLVPLDIVREFVDHGDIGSLNEVMYSTTGNGTSIKNSKEFGREIAQKLKDEHVDAVILTST